jgi:hypothetical protein
VTCDRMRNVCTPSSDRPIWANVHREIGLAGYCLAATFEPVERERALMLVIETHVEPPSQSDRAAPVVQRRLADALQLISELGRSGTQPAELADAAAHIESATTSIGPLITARQCWSIA